MPARKNQTEENTCHTAASSPAAVRVSPCTKSAHTGLMPAMKDPIACWRPRTRITAAQPAWTTNRIPGTSACNPRKPARVFAWKPSGPSAPQCTGMGSGTASK